MASDAPDLKSLLGVVANGRPLSQNESELAFDIMMSGDATPSQMGAFLMALRVRGETVEEITGAAITMRSKMLGVSAPAGAIDICGTGGDATGTYNISTASQFVVAACGIPVAKHGNRALSSKSGAADVLAALGVNLDADMSLVEKALNTAGTCFLMAPRHHSAMRHVGPTRVELGTRTLFNLLGPLCNPARVRHQVMGVFSPDWVEPLAQVLKGLGHDRAWVVHGADGMDELSTTGPSTVAQLLDGKVETFEVTPEEAGLGRDDFAELKGGDGQENAAALRAVLAGEPSAYRNMVVFGSAAALMVAGKVSDLKAGAVAAQEAIDSGRAQRVLDQLVHITNQEPHS
ncbi:MAG: anthranilate phosphoribosyltransferase [Pseudomonadota bacterium]